MVAASLEFLTSHLVPHANAEDVTLYPEVGRLTEELRTATELADVRRLLYGLYAIVRLHFAKEEEIYLPILDAGLDPPAAEAMFERMREAAKNAEH